MPRSSELLPDVVAARLLRAASRWVPRHLRARWLEEWRSELWHGRRRHGSWWALRQLGGAWRDACAARSLPSSRQRRARRAPGGFQMFLRDLSFAARGLARRPGFTAIALLTLGLGLGANVAAFTAVRSILLDPLPFRDADRLVRLFERRPHQDRLQNPVSLPDFVDWRAARSPAFADLAAWASTGAALTGLDQPLSLRGAAVSEAFFGVLGIEPQLGRAFAPEETRPGGGGVVVLGHDLWQSAFGGDPRVLGTAIELDGDPQTVVGVMPAGMAYPFDAAYWVPLTADPASASRGGHFLHVVARLATGVTVEEAYAQLDAVTRGLEAEHPAENTMHYGNVMPLREAALGGSSRVLWLLLAAVSLMLLVVCANLAGMQLSRGIGRQRELAVRASIGASRFRLVRELLAENLVLGAASSLVGLVVAQALTKALAPRLAEYAPWVPGFGLDPPAVAFALIASLVLSLVFGAMPAVACSGAPRADLLRETRSSSGVASRRLRTALVVTEIALALVLLVGSALTARSLQRLLAVDPGFQPEGVLAAEVGLPAFRYGEKQQIIDFFDRLEERLRAQPGVASVGYTWLLPFTGNESGSNFTIEGRTPPDRGDTWNARFRIADAGYFETLRIPLLAGRSFAPADRGDAPRVALVGETMAKSFWPEGDALGARFRLDDEDPWITIVGIVGDVHHSGLDVPPNPEFYIHRQQMAAGYGAVVVRAADATTAADAARRALREVDADLPIATIASMTERIDRTVDHRRLLATLAGAFGATALLLSALGLYGVVSYTVAQRTREIGVRMALGSGAGRVLQLFLREGLRLVALGLLLGGALALSLTRLLGTQLYGVRATDVPSFTLAAAVLAAVALLAVLLPARRAALLDPVTTLRAE